MAHGYVLSTNKVLTTSSIRQPKSGYLPTLRLIRSVDPVWRERGREFGEVTFGGLEGSLMIPLTNAGMSAQQVQVLVAQARREFQDASLKPYVAL